MSVPLLLSLSLLVACGPKRPRAGASLEDQLTALPSGGSSEWDAQVKALLVAAYDADGSGEIDTPKELSRIDCSVWQAIEAGMLRDSSYSALRTTYGFSEGFLWVGSALGVSSTLRKDADAVLAGCGLRD